MGKNIQRLIVDKNLNQYTKQVQTKDTPNIVQRLEKHSRGKYD
ncbi:hypothetical protein ACQUWN_02555 [Rossellomorea aquimaris]|nr:hypothetical protein [Rossellomorea vietnamensis]